MLERKDRLIGDDWMDHNPITHVAGVQEAAEQRGGGGTSVDGSCSSRPLTWAGVSFLFCLKCHFKKSEL